MSSVSDHKKLNKSDCYWCDYLTCIVKGNKRTRGKMKVSRCPMRNRPKTRNFRHKFKVGRLDE